MGCSTVFSSLDLGMTEDSTGNIDARHRMGYDDVRFTHLDITMQRGSWCRVMQLVDSIHTTVNRTKQMIATQDQHQTRRIAM